jgi:hypothetical protein
LDTCPVKPAPPLNLPTQEESDSDSERANDKATGDKAEEGRQGGGKEKKGRKGALRGKNGLLGLWAMGRMLEYRKPRWRYEAAEEVLPEDPALLMTVSVCVCVC